MKKEVSALYQDINPDELKTVDESSLLQLPKPVQRYLKFSQIIGKKEIKTVELKQKGLFRTKVGGKWIRMSATQYVNVDSMSFIWKAKASVVRVTDQFVNGRGNLKVKLFGLFTVGNALGPEIDQGESLRFLAEIIWYPSAFTNDYLQWNEVNDNASDVTLFYSDQSATARFHFRESGEIDRITAQRYREAKGEYSLDEWVISDLEYKSFAGIVVPYKANVSWELEGGEFCYGKFELTQVSFNGLN